MKHISINSLCFALLWGAGLAAATDAKTMFVKAAIIMALAPISFALDEILPR